MKNILAGIAAFVSLAIMTASCNADAKEEVTLRDYDLTNPEKFIMPESLLEISGITFYKGNSDTIYTIQDEEGKVFRLAWGVKKQYHSKFAKKGDYEDLAIMNDKVIVLKSNGTLFSFAFADAIYEEVDSVQEWKGILPVQEYEGMYADESTSNLYVICKNCSDDDSKDKVSGYILHFDDSIKVTGNFSVDVEQIKSFTGKVKRGFRPSALAKNEMTGEWYIISAVNKLLVVTDNSWMIKEVSPLNSNVFNQPEGIAFDKAGNLYISNEGDDLVGGNILKFVRKDEPSKTPK